MKSVLFRKVHIIDATSPHHNQLKDVRIEDQTIVELGDPGTLEIGSSEELHFPEGSCVSPGWVDSMVQLNDPGFEYKESLDHLSTAAQKGGFTHVICTPNTSPVLDNSQILHSLKSRTQFLPTEFHFCGSITEQAQGVDLAEVYDMHQAGAVGFSDGSHPLPNGGIFLRALQYTSSFKGLLIQSPADASLIGDGQMNEGNIATQLGMPGIPELAEIIPVRRDLELYAYEPGKVHFHPISSPKAMHALAQAKQSYADITIGTNLYYLILTDQLLQEFDPVYKVFPPLRNENQVTALKQALKNGDIDLLSSGHHAQGIEEKQVEFKNAEPGMLGLQTFYPVAQTHLVDQDWLSLSDLIQTITGGPRKIFDLPSVSIQEGGGADLTIFHPTGSFELNQADIPSRAKNSPWLDTKLTGKVLGTYYKGKYQSSD
ncbi:MAG: dihydroorotase [Bacteroidota bacterium]